MQRRVVGLLALFVAVVGGLFAHAARYYPFFSDDALITLRYTQRLCQGKGLTWTDGQRVEGYSDLLWVLVNAPATCAGLDPMWSARVLDFMGAVVAIWAVGLPARGGRLPSAERLIGGGVALASAAPVAVWSIGGLEHGFMFGLLALALHFATRSSPSARDVSWASFFFGLLVLCRADGIVLFAAASAGWLLFAPSGMRRLREVARWCAFPFGLCAAQLAFRLAYYGEWVPNTALAKVSLSWTRVELGIQHLRSGLLPLGFLLGVALAGAVISWRRGARLGAVMPIAVAVGWCGYVALVGGDIFPGWRQLSLAHSHFRAAAAGGTECKLPCG